MLQFLKMLIFLKTFERLQIEYILNFFYLRFFSVFIVKGDVRNRFNFWSWAHMLTYILTPCSSAPVRSPVDKFAEIVSSVPNYASRSIN